MSENLEFFRNVKLFNMLPNTQLEKIAVMLKKKTYKKDSMIFFEGDMATGFYIVFHGQVKVFKLAGSGKEQILNVFNSGDVFGEVPVFAGTNFPANCQVIKDAEVLYLSRQQFIDLIKKDPQLALSLLALLSQRLRDFTVTIENLTLKEVGPRFAAYLLHIYKTQESTDIKLDVSKTLLANILGVSRETLSRTMKKLEQNSLIVVHGQNIKLCDLEKLKVLSDIL